MAIKAIRKTGKPTRTTVKTIGAHSYAIPDIPARPRGSIVSQITTLCLIPVFLFRLFIHSVLMWLGPKSLKESLLVRIIPAMMKNIENVTENQRKLLLQHLHGRVLDIGSGAGSYFRFLKKKASHVVALEPVQKLHEQIRQSASEAGLAPYQVTIAAETLEDYYARTADKATFDWIILGNVLCEVADPLQTLQHIHELLKPGGHVYFCEHQGCAVGTRARKIQDFMNPWWKTVSGGCNCNRHTLHAIEGMADWEVVSWEFENVQVLFGPMVMGLARKVEV